MSNQVTIYGASDDLIEIEGVLREEFAYNDGEHYIATSDGSLLGIRYDGCWRITPMAIGPDTEYSIVQAVGEDDDNYSDRATLTSIRPFIWVANAEACRIRAVKS